ncbi:methyltransferase domain-containing protein [Paenibacillus athensensis]|uniref:SAM-dependent methyltransferase n=1 Tax=Paenibacillus athensensis TaxID=1967502 RepID=A0A4Y8Q1W0_9BACL|nr:class I SAM-dependent methyltransferase [Paenibacillus athensensis]MCD1261001.1 methyltransferase domain-containing protein [Paenibacillus athensensis]
MTASNSQEWKAQQYDTAMSFVSKYGESVLELLAPQPGERILDLGCGTGDLAAELARRGAVPEGIDVSASMIEEARVKYPGLPFAVADATAYRSERRFDGVFSNAALHWVKPPEAAVETVRQALRTGGRFAAEFGGKGNIAAIAGAVAAELAGLGIDAQARNPWYYPSIGEYTTLLEAHGFRVAGAWHFDRPTPLAGGENGLRLWIDTFAAFFFAGFDAGVKERALQAIEERLRPQLYKDGQWTADYVRIRVLAYREE